MKVRIKLVATPEKLTDRIRKQLEDLDAKTFPLDIPYPKDGCYWWIGYDEDGTPVAFAGLKPLSGQNNGCGFLCRAGVLKEARGQNLQRRFVTIRRRKARSVGLSQIITYTSKCNHSSAANLIKSGMHFYTPPSEWGVSGAMYFINYL